jgi:hypothetical protein
MQISHGRDKSNPTLPGEAMAKRFNGVDRGD